MRFVILALLAVLAILQYRLWVGAGSLAEVRRLERQLSTQRAENEQLEQRNRQLEAEVKDLKNGLDAIEERARSELGMVGKDETYYMIVEPAGQPAIAEPRP